jgi:hypothetical protein
MTQRALAYCRRESAGGAIDLRLISSRIGLQKPASGGLRVKPQFGDTGCNLQNLNPWRVAILSSANGNSHR